MRSNTNIIRESVIESFRERVKKYSIPEVVEIEDGVEEESDPIIFWIPERNAN